MTVSVKSLLHHTVRHYPLRAVILAALPVEYSAVRSRLAGVQEQTHPQGTVYEIGRFIANARKWEIGVVEIGQGNTAAAAEAERAIQFLKPELVLFVGVAGGIKDVALGDVVVATKVYAYESGKAKGTFEPRPEVMRSTYRLENRARAEANKAGWRRRMKKSSSTAKPSVLVGPMAAGAKVVASTRSDTFQFIRTNYGDALAVEMEGYGFLAAAHANPETEAIVIRGISDLVNHKGVSDARGYQEVVAHNAAAFAFELLAHYSSQDRLSETSHDAAPSISNSTPHHPKSRRRIFTADLNLESLIKDVGAGDWDTAALVAIEVLKTTAKDGSNRLFEALLEFQDRAQGNEILWSVTMVVEACAQFAPALVNHEILARMASHGNFVIRSAAASICMDLAQFAPDRVPVDILLPLSKYDEDWYVQAPANAALKSIVASQPAVHQIYYLRLTSDEPEERAHASRALLDIAKKEPEVIIPSQLKQAYERLVELDDGEARQCIEMALPLVQKVRKRTGYKYGL